MPRPATREALLVELQESWHKLAATLSVVAPEQTQLTCIDGLTITQLIAVRLWWTRRVNQWIKQGQRNHHPALPAPNYTWRQTPALNNNTAAGNRASLTVLQRRLATAVGTTVETINTLSDAELLKVGIFNWTGNWPASRWISVNMTRQYTTARTHIRRALR